MHLDLKRTDPRHYQIVSLSILLLVGGGLLAFPVNVGRFAITIGVGLFVQVLGSRLVGLPFDARSPLITSLALLLILRTGSPLTMACAAAIAIGSKFLLRADGRHVFNPANLGIIAVVLCTKDAWISPGQWGSASLLLTVFACLGLLVTTRARRADISLTFLGVYATALFARALWLGDPLTIPARALESGTLLLFAFFMISDPATTPRSRAGRIAFGSWIAGLSIAITYGLHQPNAFLWALFVSMPAVPVINRLLEPRRAALHVSTDNQPKGKLSMRPPRLALRLLGITTVLIALLSVAPPVRAFCGFYVAKADTGLFNRASEVVLVRDGNRTVITMSNDFRGSPTEFAMVVPVPTLLQEGQIHVADRAVLDHLDAYTSPRLVEYFDPDPCAVNRLRSLGYVSESGVRAEQKSVAPAAKRDADGVTIEASYTVGEYDILILSARESDGLEAWLTRNGYRLPKGASRVLGSYLRQGMRFFVAKVNLEEQTRLGFNTLRPLQIAFESPKFMLPIRLGTLNADGDQELFVYTLTRNGRVETTNYRTIRLPSGEEIPTFVKAEFGDFYKDMFAQQVEREPLGVFLEYAWDMGWCDPCAADPLSQHELRDLGVFWVGDAAHGNRPGGAQNVFVTRLHVRYNSRTFPEDLRFHETKDRTNFQGRYVLRHAYKGATCPEAQQYYSAVERRFEQEAQRLANLTGWSIGSIRSKIRAEHGGRLGDLDGVPNNPDEDGDGRDRWWEKLWPGRRR